MLLPPLGGLISGPSASDLNAMQMFLIMAVISAAAATVYVLVRGVIGMAQGSSNLNAARSQSLMQKRLTYQAVAVLFVMLLLALGGGSQQ